MKRYVRAATVLGVVSMLSLVVTVLTALPASAAGFVPVRHAVTGRCVDVRGKSTERGAVIQQWSCTGNSNQQWLRNPVSGGFQLIGQGSGLCLDIRTGTSTIPNGTPLQLWDCPFSAVWQLRDPFGNTGQYFNPDTGKCIDLADGSSADGAKIQMWDCIANDTNQLWTMTP
jgi:hypothetical protein